MHYATTYLPGVSNPLQGNTSGESSSTGSTQGGDSSSTAPFYVLVETHGSSEEHDTAKLNTFLEVGRGLDKVMFMITLVTIGLRQGPSQPNLI
jgi:hypothetical protein